MEEQTTLTNNDPRLKQPEFKKHREQVLLGLLSDPLTPHDMNGRISWKDLWAQRPSLKEELGANTERGLSRLYAVASYLDPARREKKQKRDRERLQKSRQRDEHRAAGKAKRSDNNQSAPAETRAWHECPRCGLNFAQLTLALNAVNDLKGL